MAESEWFRIQERTQAGKLRAMERDNAPPGGPVTFGYRILPNGQWEADPAQAAVVRRMFEMILEGFSQNEIGEWVRSLPGMPTGRSFMRRDGSPVKHVESKGLAPWNNSRVSRLLSNRQYLGERHWGDRAFPIPALIDQETWDRVQAIRTGRALRTGRLCAKGQPSLLSGLLTCGECGGSIHGVWTRYPTKRPVGKVGDASGGGKRLYRCRNTATPFPTCKARTFTCRLLDEQVWPLLRSFLVDPGKTLADVLRADQVEAGQLADVAGQLALVAGQLAALDVETEEVWALQRSNGWPVKTVESPLRAIQQRREALLREQERLCLARDTRNRSKEEISQVAAALSDLRALLPAADQDATLRARIAKALVRGGTATTVRQGSHGSTAVRLELKWGATLTGEGKPIVVDPTGKGPPIGGSKAGAVDGTGLPGLRSDAKDWSQETQRILFLPLVFTVHGCPVQRAQALDGAGQKKRYCIDGR